MAYPGERTVGGMNDSRPADLAGVILALWVAVLVIGYGGMAMGWW